IEGASDHDIEPSIRCFTGSSYKIGPRHRAEFGAEKNRSATFLIPFHVVPFGADQFTGPWCERSERDAIFSVGLLDTSRFEALKDRLCEVGSAVFDAFDRVDQAVVRINRQHPVR